MRDGDNTYMNVLHMHHMRNSLRVCVTRQTWMSSYPYPTKEGVHVHNNTHNNRTPYSTCLGWKNVPTWLTFKMTLWGFPTIYPHYFVLSKVFLQRAENLEWRLTQQNCVLQWDTSSFVGLFWMNKVSNPQKRHQTQLRKWSFPKTDQKQEVWWECLTNSDKHTLLIVDEENTPKHTERWFCLTNVKTWMSHVTTLRQKNSTRDTNKWTGCVSTHKNSGNVWC